MAWVRPAAAASRVGEVGAVYVRIRCSGKTLSSRVLPLGMPESFLLIIQEPHPPFRTALRGGGPALAWTLPDIAFAPENTPLNFTRRTFMVEFWSAGEEVRGAEPGSLYQPVGKRVVQ